MGGFAFRILLIMISHVPEIIEYILHIFFHIYMVVPYVVLQLQHLFD